MSTPSQQASSNLAPSCLGPSCLSTLVCKDLAAVQEHYCNYLSLQVLRQNKVSTDLATLWQAPELAGAPSVLLANALGEPWLRLVQDLSVIPLAPLTSTGWLSLEVLVQDVDSLVAGLAGSPFKVLRPVANLELSDNIRACQVSGPCGEVFYLTQINGDVPPFDLPRARCAVDRLFIPVLCAHDRDQAQRFYEAFPRTKALAFDTKITVVNQAYGLPLERQYPVATMLLRGQSLIEIDEIPQALPRQPLAGRLPSNIASISFEVDNLAALNLQWFSTPRPIAEPPYAGRNVGVAIGAAGEWLELIERTESCVEQ